MAPTLKCERCSCDIKHLETYFIVQKSSVKCAPRKAFGQELEVMHVCPGEEFWRQVFCVECYKAVHENERYQIRLDDHRQNYPEQYSLNLGD